MLYNHSLQLTHNVIGNDFPLLIRRVKAIKLIPIQLL